MTNVEIIMRQEAELIENGIIAEDERIHTYQMWKSLGFQVKKGEHAITKFPVWKPAKGKKKVDEDGNEVEKGRPYMFMKTASFFSSTQVEPIS